MKLLIATFVFLASLAVTSCLAATLALATPPKQGAETHRQERWYSVVRITTDNYGCKAVVVKRQASWLK
jgi:hypothetical protein